MCHLRSFSSSLSVFVPRLAQSAVLMPLFSLLSPFLAPLLPLPPLLFLIFGYFDLLVGLVAMIPWSGAGLCSALSEFFEEDGGRNLETLFSAMYLIL